MMEVAILACLLLLVACVVILLVLLRRSRTGSTGIDAQLVSRLDALERRADSLPAAIRDEAGRGRSEAGDAARLLREEVGHALRTSNESVQTTAQALRQELVQQIHTFSEGALAQMNHMRSSFAEAVERSKSDSRQAFEEFRVALVQQIETSAVSQRQQHELVATRVNEIAAGTEARLGTARETIEKQLAMIQETNNQRLGEMRAESKAATEGTRVEITTALKTFQDAVRVQLDESALHTRRSLAEVVTGLGKVSESNELRMETLRTVVESRLKEIQEDNTKKLDLVRQTVDEKLEGTLERRLGESFKLVSERLEQVHKGLGEMQSLATGVGDLKKVLSNVKSRGTWGEYQLGGLLEQVLTPEQYAQNVATKPGSNERVEFAIRLPGPHDDPSRPLWLPIDAKCPVEDYRRIVDATEQGDVDGAREGIKQLEVRIRACAESISSKYLSPPDTTDFGVLFVPTEGLYAEILRTPGLAESLQHEHRVMVAGPTTLWALLSSLQMGFRTLAIEKRSSEVWNVLSAVKTEFAKFEVVFKKVKKKLVEASNTIDDASRRTRAVERSLRTVHELPLPAAAQLLGLPESNSDTEADALSPTSSEGQ